MDKPLILFDFDGTLANSFPIGMQHANDLAKYFSYPKLDNLETIRDQSAIRFIFSQVKWYYLPFWAYMMKKRLLESALDIELFAGIPEMLNELQKHSSLGIISGNSVEYQNKILDRHSIQVFHIQIGNNGTKKHRAINRLLKKGYSKDKIIFVGDDVQDVLSAKRCEVKTVAVSWGSSSVDLLRTVDPDELVESVDELAKLLNRETGN